MAWELPLFKLPGFVAETDLSESQFHALNPGTDEGEADIGDASGPFLGVLQNTPDVGEAVEVMAKGITKAISGAAVTLHAEVEVDGNGQFIDLAEGTAVGIALEASGGADETITVLLT